ncbi:hypothetical protein ACVXHB_13425 [Escherichia coli]
MLAMTTNAGVRETQRKSIGLSTRITAPMPWQKSEKSVLHRNSVTVSTTLSGSIISTDVIHQVVDKFIVELQVQLDSEKASLWK